MRSSTTCRTAPSAIRPCGTTDAGNLLGGFGIFGIVGATLPLALVVALTALELLVAFLQAYVFAILTCIYLNDAIHPGH